MSEFGAFKSYEQMVAGPQTPEAEPRSLEQVLSTVGLIMEAVRGVDV